MQRWQTIRARSFDRHSHDHAYAAVVLSGRYEEAGDHGRFHVQAGDVVTHGLFESHINRFSALGAVILNLDLPAEFSSPGIARIGNPDAIVRAAEKNETEASSLLLASLEGGVNSWADWPDELANALIQKPSTNLLAWGDVRGLAPWTISRGFAQVFGVSPSVFRARARTRHAWQRIEKSDAPLVEISASLGFSDQPHMNRSVKALTGKTPLSLRRRANGFKIA
jgi:AraC-like DNA-binding protein